MRKFGLVSCFSFIVLLLSATQAFAYFPNGWRVNAQINVNRTQMKATVYNVWGRPVVCRGQAFGFTRSGVRLNSWVRNVVVYPGNFHTVYVHSNFHDPFVNGRADIWCRWR